MATEAKETVETPHLRIATAKERARLRKRIHWSVWNIYRQSSETLGMDHPLTQALHTAATEVSDLPVRAEK